LQTFFALLVQSFVLASANVGPVPKFEFIFFL